MMEKSRIFFWFYNNRSIHKVKISKRILLALNRKKKKKKKESGNCSCRRMCFSMTIMERSQSCHKTFPTLPWKISPPPFPICSSQGSSPCDGQVVTSSLTQTSLSPMSWGVGRARRCSRGKLRLAAFRWNTLLFEHSQALLLLLRRNVRCSHQA